MAASNRIESLLPSLNLVPSSPAMCCDCAISESASTHPPPIPRLLPPFPLPSLFPVSPSTGDKFTWFKVAPATPLWCVCESPHTNVDMSWNPTPTTLEMETAPVAALHARLVFGGSTRLGASLLTWMRSVSHSIRRNSPRQHLPSSKREKWRWNRKRDSNWSQPRNIVAFAISLSLSLSLWFIFIIQLRLSSYFRYLTAE